MITFVKNFRFELSLPVLQSFKHCFLCILY